MPPLINSIYQLSILFKGATPAVSSFNILDKDKKRIIKDNKDNILNFKEKIKFDNLSFRYNKTSPYILNKVNIEISGDKAIKGQTGSGKLL